MLGLAHGKSVVYGFFFLELFSLKCLVVRLPQCWQGQTCSWLGLRVVNTQQTEPLSLLNWEDKAIPLMLV